VRRAKEKEEVVAAAELHAQFLRKPRTPRHNWRFSPKYRSEGEVVSSNLAGCAKRSNEINIFNKIELRPFCVIVIVAAEAPGKQRRAYQWPSAMPASAIGLTPGVSAADSACSVCSPQKSDRGRIGDVVRSARWTKLGQF
jgi:hypothetical protein